MWARLVVCVCVCVCGPYVGSQAKEVVCMCNQITGGRVYLKEIDCADVVVAGGVGAYVLCC